MAVLHLFNPENDLALAADMACYTPPPAAVRLRSRGALLPLWFASEGDLIMAPPELEASALRLRDEYGLSEGYEERFKAGEPQKQLSKEFVRQWLIDHDFMGKAGQKVPEMTPEFCDSVSARYIELYEHVTGQPFVKENENDLARRIEVNVLDCLKNLSC